MMEPASVLLSHEPGTVERSFMEVPVDFQDVGLGLGRDGLEAMSPTREETQSVDLDYALNLLQIGGCESKRSKKKIEQMARQKQ